MTDVSGITGEHSGNGYAKITVIEAHTDYDPDKVFDLVKKATGNNYSLIPDSVTTDGHTIINPFWSCQCIYDGHVCTKHCKTTYVLQCKEPHHKAVNGKIGHYDAGNEICYDACHNDELHKKGAEQANAGKPGTSKPLKFGDFVLLDNYFIFTSQTVATFMSQMIMESPRPNSGREKDIRIIMTARSGPEKNGSNFHFLFCIIGTEPLRSTLRVNGSSWKLRTR